MAIDSKVWAQLVDHCGATDLQVKSIARRISRWEACGAAAKPLADLKQDAEKLGELLKKGKKESHPDLAKKARRMRKMALKCEALLAEIEEGIHREYAQAKKELQELERKDPSGGVGQPE